MVTLRRTASGKYFVTFMCVEIMPVSKPARHSSVGIDLGLTDLAISSRGDKTASSKYFRASQRKLRHAQQALSRKTKGSNRYRRQRTKVARIHEKIFNQRNDATHQFTDRLIHENQVVGLEDLNVKGMLRNHHLALSIADSGWSELVRQVEYKAQWYGRTVVKVDRWAPTSKTCSECGFLMDKLALSIRQWECPECQVAHDRDVNAARNIERLALESLALESLTIESLGKISTTGGRPGCNARGEVGSGLNPKRSQKQASTQDSSETDLCESRIFAMSDVPEWTGAKA